MDESQFVRDQLLKESQFVRSQRLESLRKEYDAVEAARRLSDWLRFAVLASAVTIQIAFFTAYSALVRIPKPYDIGYVELMYESLWAVPVGGEITAVLAMLIAFGIEMHYHRHVEHGMFIEKRLNLPFGHFYRMIFGQGVMSKYSFIWVLAILYMAVHTVWFPLILRGIAPYAGR